MKKICLIAGILTVGFMSANTTSSKKVKLSNGKYEKALGVKVLVNNIKAEQKDSKIRYPIYYTTSCGVQCMTNQCSWGTEQMFDWADALEANYCAD